MRFFLRGVCIQISTALQFSVFIKGKILWHLRQNHSIILKYSTFWTTLTWAPVLLEILFSFSFLHEAVTISHYSVVMGQKHCEYQSNIYERWWGSGPVFGLGGILHMLPRTSLWHNPRKRSPSWKKQLVLLFHQKPQTQKDVNRFFSECRRRSPG